MPRVVTEKVKKSCSALVGRELRKKNEAFQRQRRMQDRRTLAGGAGDEKWCAVGCQPGVGLAVQCTKQDRGARTSG